MNKIKGLSFFICAAISFNALASKPKCERDAEASEALERAAAIEKVKLASASALAPLHAILGSTRCAKIAERWRAGDIADRSFPTAGLVQMYRTAEIAANTIIDNLNIRAKVVQPVYNKQSPFEGAAATLDLMRSARPPEYIRNAVLIRDRVLMVVPLLQRLRAKDGETGQAVYAPIITKGHQELHEFDVLSAAFAAWALEEWQKVLPEKAFVYLRSMEKQRKLHDEKEQVYFEIDPSEYLPRVTRALEKFKSIVRDEAKMKEVADGAVRCTQCARCAWASFCRKKFKEAKHLSMVPFPPTPQQQAMLHKVGYPSLNELADLDVNSDAFIETAIVSGIPPLKLRYYIARALSTKLNKPFVLNEYSDPVTQAAPILHIDFEDLMNGELVSGVYLFGFMVEESGSGEAKVEQIFSQALKQASVDEGWANFIRYVRDHKALKGDKYFVTIYSKHEQAKFEQEFDMLRLAPSQFSEEQRGSNLYHETHLPSGKVIGRLIRNTKFFDNHPDISPEDVFEILDRNRLIDLLDYPRRHLVFPGYTNSLKAILPYVQGTDPQLIYLDGANGLESLAWSVQAYATGEQHLFDKIGRYNTIDVKANAAVLKFIRELAGQPGLEKLQFGDEISRILPEVEEVVSLKKLGSELQDLSALFEQALGRPLSDIAKEDLDALRAILDRSEYLAELREISLDGRETGTDVRGSKQAVRFQFNEERASLLKDWLEKLNPAPLKSLYSSQTEALVEILEYPSNRLAAKKIDFVLAYEHLRAHFADEHVKAGGSIRTSLETPAAWLKKLSKLGNGEMFEMSHLVFVRGYSDGKQHWADKDEDEAAGVERDDDLTRLAKAIYFNRRFEEEEKQ